MSDATTPDLETVVDQPDEQFRANLGPALAGLDDEDALAELLVTRPTVFERLTDRMATFEGITEFATDEPETVEQYLRVLWGGMGLIAENISAVGDAVTVDTTVNWTATDSPIAFHATTDPETGSIAGGPTLAEDAEITFEGQTEVLFRMLGDDEFNGQLAFVQNRFDVIGPLERSREFNDMMESVGEAMEALV
ncbi:hypothetical protein BV210_08575 [Halorientalis sp. IM1011]|uniref:hypothetical protein n=1 Tax=Halorientalis sp. IM1011 TaxID=1932360 RepID=UPI00097CCD13|nr:hypothetical protein [Halorientalis sp. IM1011]AQL42760.1 hypothetical protein BV210_08575 [Halorientalis sp. IM1011]